MVLQRARVDTRKANIFCVSGEPEQQRTAGRNSILKPSLANFSELLSRRRPTNSSDPITGRKQLAERRPADHLRLHLSGWYGTIR